MENKEVKFYCRAKYIYPYRFDLQCYNDRIPIITSLDCITVFSDGTTDKFGYFYRNNRFLYSYDKGRFIKVCRIIEYCLEPISIQYTSTYTLLQSYAKLKRDIREFKRRKMSNDLL